MQFSTPNIVKWRHNDVIMFSECLIETSGNLIQITEEFETWQLDSVQLVSQNMEISNPKSICQKLWAFNPIRTGLFERRHFPPALVKFDPDSLGQ